MSATRILDELSRTGIALLLREPFYAHLFGNINKEVVAKGHPVDSLAVGLGHNSLTLYVNAEFWDNVLTNPDHRYGVLKHEMLHLIFRHLFVREPFLDSRLLNVAFDLVVNQYVTRSSVARRQHFPGESFPDLHLEAGQTWFYYYKKIEALRNGSRAAANPGRPMPKRCKEFGQIRTDWNGTSPGRKSAAVPSWKTKCWRPNSTACCAPLTNAPMPMPGGICRANYGN